MSVADYGIVNTFTAYTYIFFMIVGLTLHSSIKNANLDYPNDVDSYCSSLTILIIGCFVLSLLISICFRNELSGLLSLDHPFLLSFIVADSFCLAMITYYNCVLAVNYRYKEYLMLSLAYSVSGIGFSVLFILIFHSSVSYLGRILGTCISSAMVTIFILYRLYRKSVPKVNMEFWKYGLKISLPVIPHGISQIILAQFDRLIIKSTIGNEEAGLYSFAYTLGTVYQVVANSIDTAWSQWLFEQMAAKNYSKIRKIANYYAGILALGAIMLMLISPELVLIMGGTKYRPSRQVTLPIILSMFYAAMYAMPASLEYFYKKTKLIAIATTAAAGLNIVLNMIYIPKYGYIAAAYTTVACYLIYYAMHMVFAYKIHGSMLYDVKWQGLCVFVVTLAVFVCQCLMEYLLLRAVIIMTGLFAFLMIGIRMKEKWMRLFKAFKS